MKKPIGLFGFFKKKENFDDIIKEPLSDPLGPAGNDFASLPTGTDNLSPGGLPQSSFGFNDNMLGSNTPLNPWDKDPMGASNNSTNAASLPSFDNSGFREPKGFGNFSAPNQGFQPQQRELPQQGYGQNNYNQERNTHMDHKDAELISAKLDTIKSMLENLNHRVDNIEKEFIAKNEDTPKQNNRRPYW